MTDYLREGLRPQDAPAYVASLLEKEFDGKLNITHKEGWYWFPFKGDYGVTLLNTIGLPDSWSTMSPASKVAMLLHEAQHVRQQLKLGRGNIYLGFLIQMVLYLFVPFPIGIAYCRAYLEMEAYKESIRGYYLMSGKNLLVINSSGMRANILKQFTGSRYFWMWPFKSHLNKWYDRIVEEVILEEG